MTLGILLNQGCSWSGSATQAARQMGRKEHYKTLWVSRKWAGSGSLQVGTVLESCDREVISSVPKALVFWPKAIGFSRLKGFHYNHLSAPQEISPFLTKAPYHL